MGEIMLDRMNRVTEGKEIRERIQKISKTKVRVALMYQFITATRVSEVCGKYALTGKDFQTTSFEDHPVLLFTILGKRGVFPRSVALPLEEKYEPWSKEVLQYCLNQSVKDNKKDIFRLTPRSLQMYCAEAFKGLSYFIESYGGVEGHSKRVLTHALRHIRASELMMKYGFDGIDLAVYCGWSLTSMSSGMSKMARRYVVGQWGRYFPKLIKPYKL